MAVLGEYPGISADEVSLKTQIEKSILSRAISKLLQRKLVAACATTCDMWPARHRSHLSRRGTRPHRRPSETHAHAAAAKILSSQDR